LPVPESNGGPVALTEEACPPQPLAMPMPCASRADDIAPPDDGQVPAGYIAPTEGGPAPPSSSPPTEGGIVQEVKYASGWVDKMVQLQELCYAREGHLKLVFVGTLRAAEQVEQELVQGGVEAMSVHRDRTLPEREHAVQLFQERQVDVLVTTDVGAQGLVHFDLPDVAYVVNFDLPADAESYVRRIGRRGHDCIAVSFVTDRDGGMLQELEQLLHDSDQDVPRWLPHLVQTASHDGGGVVEHVVALLAGHMPFGLTLHDVVRVYEAQFGRRPAADLLQLSARLAAHRHVRVRQSLGAHDYFVLATQVTVALSAVDGDVKVGDRSTWTTCRRTSVSCWWASASPPSCKAHTRTCDGTTWPR